MINSAGLTRTVGLFMLACAPLVLAGNPRTQQRPEPLPATVAVPLSEIVLPFQGHGDIEIMDDGSIAIWFVRMEEDAESNGKHGFQRFGFSQSGRLGYSMDTRGLSIVEHDGEIFLDKSGAQIKQRRLGLQNVLQTRFPDSNEMPRESAPEVLFSLNGELELDYDEGTGELALVVVERGESGRVFRLTAPVAPDDEEGDSPPWDSDDSITLIQSCCVSASACSAVCKKGECSISCQGACRAGCSGGNPICTCVQ